MSPVPRQNVVDLPARVALLGGLRTPFVQRSGALRAMGPAELLGQVLGELVARHEIAPEDVGVCALTLAPLLSDASDEEVAAVVARAGLPREVNAYAVARGSLSSLETATLAATAVAHRDVRAALAGAAESGSQRHISVPARLSGLLREAARAGSMWGAARVLMRAQRADVRTRRAAPGARRGVDLTRAEVDAFVEDARRRAREDAHEGHDVLRVFAPPSFVRPVAADDVPCPTAEADGACGLLLTLEDRARAEGRDVEAIVRGWSWTPPEPEGGASLARAATRALAGAGAGLDDVAAVEVHATTAEEIVLTTRVLESRTIARRVLGSEAPLGALSPHRVNVRGGSAALGHAPAATGARVILDAARALDGGSRPFALALVSGADGAAGAMLLEAPR